MVSIFSKLIQQRAMYTKLTTSLFLMSIVCLALCIMVESKPLDDIPGWLYQRADNDKDGGHKLDPLVNAKSGALGAWLAGVGTVTYGLQWVGIGCFGAREEKGPKKPEKEELKRSVSLLDEAYLRNTMIPRQNANWADCLSGGFMAVLGSIGFGLASRNLVHTYLATHTDKRSLEYLHQHFDRNSSEEIQGLLRDVDINKSDFLAMVEQMYNQDYVSVDLKDKYGHSVSFYHDPHTQITESRHPLTVGDESRDEDLYVYAAYRPEEASDTSLWSTNGDDWHDMALGIINSMEDWNDADSVCIAIQNTITDERFATLYVSFGNHITEEEPDCWKDSGLVEWFQIGERLEGRY